MKISRRTLGALTAVAALSLSACGGGATGGGGGADVNAETGRGALLKIGALQDVQSWDPALAHVGHQLQPFQTAYDTLILRAPDGELKPMLATEWKYTDDTLKTLELKLRDDVTFSDGEKFNAAAVVANIEHFRASGGRQVGQAKAIESVEATDDTTVLIKLSQPDPAMEYYLSQALGLMGSPKALDTDGIDRLPVGSGPYVMVAEESAVGNQYVFKAREDYWNPDLQKWDSLTLRILPDVTARVNAITSGEVDAVLLDGTTYEQAERSGLTPLQWEVDWGGMTLYDRAGQKAEPLKDVRVRQAINYAFDREALLRELFGGKGKTTSQVFGENTTAYIPELDDYYTHDVEKAKSLLAEAGYPNGFDLTIPVVTPGGETVNTFVAQQLGDIGINVTQAAVPQADYVASVGKGDYAVGWYNLFQGPTWVAIQQIISTDALYNPFDSTTPEVEGWINEIRMQTEKADQAAKDLNRYMVENAWFAPWYRMSQLYYYDGNKITVEPQTQMAVPSIYNYAPKK